MLWQKLETHTTKLDRFWIGAAMLTLLLRILLSEEQIEVLYARGLFPVIRKILDFIHLIIPIHFLIFLILGLLIWLVGKTLIVIRRKVSWKKRLSSFLLKTISFLSVVFTIFMWFWGFNYGRVGIYDQLEITGQEISNERIKKLAEEQQELISQLRSNASNLPDSGSTARYILPENIDEQITAATLETFRSLGLGVPGKPIPKMLRPKGALLSISTAGFYSPWTGESNIDAGLHPLQIPFVMAHELSHGMGITDEGGCNFLAVLIGRRLNEPTLRYAFELSYWRYVMRALRQQDEAGFEVLRSQLPSNISNDIHLIRLNGAQYPDLFPKLRNLFYDNYLKSQGVKAGLKSYEQVVNMMEAWEQKEK